MPNIAPKCFAPMSKDKDDSSSSLVAEYKLGGIIRKVG